MAEKQETKMTQLAPNRLANAEHAHQTFVATPEAGTPPDALLDPKYWAHYSVNPNMEIKSGDMILVKPEDGTYFMELLAREVYRGGVRVVELRRVLLDAKALEPLDLGDYILKHSGSRIKWRVIRKADNRDLVTGLENRTAAEAWIKEHEKALRAA